jgi:hypothetical protein
VVVYLVGLLSCPSQPGAQCPFFDLKHPIQDRYIHTIIYTGLVWTCIALGRVSFLSSALAFHFLPGHKRLPGKRTILFIFVGLAERAIVCRLGFE